MNEDDVLRAVRSAREAYSQQFGYDLGAIVRDLREWERAGGRRVVHLTLGHPRPVAREVVESPT